MSRRFAVRYDLLRDQVKYAEAKSAGPAQVSMDLHRKVKRRFTGDLILPEMLDPVTDRLRPVMLLDGKEYPLGQFVLTGLRLLQRGKERVFRCEGQDLGYLVLRSRTEKRLFFQKGQRYTDAVQNLLQSCGIRSASVKSSEKVFACDRCDWEVGSSVLDVIDALLEEIGYVSLWFDRNGVAQVHPHRRPTAEQIDHRYGPGRESSYGLIQTDFSRENDLFARCNVMTVLCENPDLGLPMIATAVNDDPDSPLAVRRAGRIMAPLVKVKNIPDQAALQEYAQQLLWEATAAQETTVIETEKNPLHECGDILALEGKTAPGIYQEIGWTLQLSAEGSMEHRLRRGMIL